MEAVWSPEVGFDDRRLYPEPLIVKAEGKVNFDWDHLQTDLKERCEAQKCWFPEAILQRNILFPIPIGNTEFYESFFNAEALIWAKQFLLANTLIPFRIPTPAVYCMLMPGRHDETMLSTDIALLYLVVIYNMSPSGKTAPGLQPPEIIKMMQDIGDRESAPLASAFFATAMRSGMMQHYFMPDRHADAPQWLCRILAMYTLRMLQLLERQVLRLSSLGYIRDESAQLAMCTRSCVDNTAGVTGASAQLYKLQMCDDYFENPANRPAQMTELPSLEQIEQSNFHLGINVKYAESVLWYLQARLRFPPPAPEEQTPLLPH